MPRFLNGATLSPLLAAPEAAGPALRLHLRTGTTRGRCAGKGPAHIARHHRYTRQHRAVGLLPRPAGQPRPSENRHLGPAHPRREPPRLFARSGRHHQGTPLAYYFARKDTRPPNPTIAVMNALDYDAMACGNHEFNFGLPVLWKAK